MQCFIAAAAVGLLWVICGYSLAFSSGGGSFIGNFAKAFLNGVDLTSVVANYGTDPVRYIPEYRLRRVPGHVRDHHARR